MFGLILKNAEEVEKMICREKEGGREGGRESEMCDNTT